MTTRPQNPTALQPSRYTTIIRSEAYMTHTRLFPFNVGAIVRALAILSIATVAARAQEKTWIGAVDSSWAVGGNWSPSALVTELDSVLYDSASESNLVQTLDQNWAVTGVRIATATNPITILPGAGNFVLTNTGGIDMSAATADLTILADYHPINGGTWNVAAGRTLTVSNTLVTLDNTTTGATAGAGTVRIVGAAKRLTDQFNSVTVVVDGGSIVGNPPVRLSADSGATVTVLVTNNGAVNIDGGSSTRIRLGDAANANGTNHFILDGGSVTISGSLSSGANGIFVGDNAQTVGILDINNGTIDMTDRPSQDSVLRIGNILNSIGIVNLNANGRLLTPRIDRISGYAQFNFNGGFLQTVVTGPYFENVDQLNFLAGGAVIDTGIRIVTINPAVFGTGGLTKIGTGSLTLLGTNNSYAGGTVISNGSFAVTLPMSSSSLLLCSNVNMSVTVGGSTNDGWPSTSSITLERSNTLTFSYGGASQPSSNLLSTTTLSAIGTNIINIIGAGWPTGTIRLIDYSGSINGSGTFVLGSLPVGLNARLTNNTSTTSIDLVVSSGVNNLDWHGNNATGGSGGGLWDIATSFNWNGGTAVYNEYGPETNRLGDAVRFTPSGNFTVEITTNVRPSSVMVTNTTSSAYSFVGPGKISGPTSLTKDGNNGGSVLTIATVNDYTGGTFIKFGGITLGTNDALPTAGLVTLGSPGVGANLTLNGFNQTIGGLLTGGSGMGTRRVLNANATMGTLTINVIAGQSNSFAHTIGNNAQPTADPANNLAVIKTGPGIQSFNGGTCSYGGPTTVSAGTLVFINCAAVNMTNVVTVQSGATLAGNGTGGNAIGGPIVIQNGGRMEVGNFAIGTQTISNSVTLQGEIVMQVNRTNATTADRLVANAISFGGTLTVTNLGDPLQAGDTFNLFDGAISGTFATLALPSLTGGLTWNTNNLAIDGTISVVAPPPLEFDALALVGGELILSGTGGPANGTYYVLTSTNVASPVANWTPLATNLFDGIGAFSFTNAIDPATPQRFYLLQLP